jgi:hypothetical protein
VLLVGVGVFLTLRYALKGGNGLLANLLVVGLTMIAAAGTSDFTLALSVVEALAKGMLLAVLGTAVAHVLFPEPANAPAPPVPPAGQRACQLGGAACHVDRDAGLSAGVDRAGPVHAADHEGRERGQQAGETRARHASRELIGSTLLAGVLAIVLWGR